jgi:hypothetical protein
MPEAEPYPLVVPALMLASAKYTDTLTMLHLGGAWNQQTVNAGSLAMNSREVNCLREHASAGSEGNKWFSRPEESRGRNPCRNERLQMRGVVSYYDSSAECGLISPVANSSPGAI